MTLSKQKHVEIWQRCLDYIQKSVPSKSFDTWFRPIVPIELTGKTLVIQVPSHFFYEWLEAHYLLLLKTSISQELGEGASLEYDIVVDNYAEKKQTMHYAPQVQVVAENTTYTTLGANQSPGKQVLNPYMLPGTKKEPIKSNLNPNYGFENYVEGDCNRLARSAGYAVAKNPGKTAFNPLLIYGGVGLGKTHLAQAIGIETKKHFPDKNVLFVSSEQFLSQYMQACKKDEKGQNKLNNFIHYYQMIDMLIVDDIQTWEQKTGIQQAFFQIFNFLHQNGKQIILTSDKAPIMMQGIEERLLSRFKWGLSADLQAPNMDTKISILQQKIRHDGIVIPKEVIEQLAFHVSSNIRELEGALISIIAQSSLNKKPITVELARQMIDRFVKNASKEVSIEYIIRVVCEYFKISIELIGSKTRKREVVQARHVVMHFAKKYTKHSLAQIGEKCGGRDHATVLHALRTVDNIQETDKEFRKHLENIEKNFLGLL